MSDWNKLSETAFELRRYIDSSGERNQENAIVKNLMTKRARGVYDKKLAAKLWMYYVDRMAKEAAGDYDLWHRLYPLSVRQEVAVSLNEGFLEEAATGQHDHLLPKKYQTGAKATGPRKPERAVPISLQIRRGRRMQGSELQQSDVGKPLTTEDEGFGTVLPIDVGKRVWVKPYGFAMENDEQRNQRKGGGGKRRHGGSSLPVEGDECPSCQSGTVVLEEGELRCAGECGKIWKLPRGSKKRLSVGKQVADLNALLRK